MRLSRRKEGEETSESEGSVSVHVDVQILIFVYLLTPILISLLRKNYLKEEVLDVVRGKLVSTKLSIVGDFNLVSRLSIYRNWVKVHDLGIS